MENEKNVPQEVSPLVDYLTRERRAHGHKSREIFKAEDLRASLVRKSSERIVLKGKDDKGRETVKGKAKLRYEANNLFSLSEVRAFHGRFSGDALYTRGREEAWRWDVFPPQTAREGLLAWMRPLVVALSTRIYGAFTDEDRSEVQAMVERAMADYLALNKTQRLIAEIDKAEAVFDREWATEQAMYTAKFEGGGGDGHSHA